MRPKLESVPGNTGVHAFVRAFFPHATNAYSALGFILAVATAFLPPSVPGRAPVAVLLILASVLLAAYRTWRDAVLLIPVSGRASVVVQGVRAHVGSYSGGKGLPTSPLKIIAGLELVNPTPDPVSFDQPTLTRAAWDPRLFPRDPSTLHLHRPGSRLRDRLILPVQVPARTREAPLELIVELAFLPSTPSDLAAHLGNLRSLRLPLQFPYRGLAETEDSCAIVVDVPTDSIRQQMRSYWSGSAHNAMIALMEGNKSLPASDGSVEGGQSP